MIPKLTALARFRSSDVSSAGGLPSTCAAVARWMSSPRRERVHQHRLARYVGEDPQLDLGVVGRQHRVPGLGDERAADLAAERRPDRDVLEVRPDRGEPAGGGGGLAEEGVQPAGLGVDQPGQRLEVRVQQLRLLAPLLDHLDDRVQLAELSEHPCIGRVPGLALAVDGQPEPLEQHLAELLGRAQRERALGQLVGPRLELVDLVAELGGDLREAVGVDLDAGRLHVGQHRHQRQLDVVIQPR